MRIARFFALFILPISAVCQSTFSTSGNWDASGNWTPAAVPNSTGTDVTISNNTNPTVRTNGGPYVIGNITAGKTTINVNTSASLTLGSSALFAASTKKSMTLNNASTLQIDGTLEIWGDLIVNNTLNLQISGTMIVHGNITMSNGAQIQVGGSGVLQVGGNLTGGNNTQIQTSGSGSIAVAGTLSVGGGSSSISGSNGSITAGSCSFNGGACPGTVTPVTLVDFKVVIENREVKLIWTTSSELNFDYFSVEKSLDGLIFSELSQIKGHGTTKEEHHYSYEDKNPIIGRSYYRLTSHDFDGYQEQFPIATVEYNGEKHFDVVPNPSNGNSVAFDLNFELDTESTVVIYDNLGVSFGFHKIGADMRTIIFANPLKSGVYYAKFSSPGFSTVTRFMVRE